jgi:hypothetical protein
MADEVNLSDKSLDKLAERLSKIKGNSAPSPSMGGGSGNADKSVSALSVAADALAAKMNPLGAASEAVKSAYGTLEGVIKPGLDTWRDMSKVGANFNNDIVGMTGAAKGARLDLSEFADIVKNNAGTFTGLGGSVSKGAQAFATLSKDMADSGVTDQLKQMGMTSKDINDVLAIQLAGQQTINMNDEAAKKRAIASATAMATEMDLMSKLTGKSRAEQEEIMKKAQADMQAEAKLRLLTMGKSEEEAAAIRNNYYAQQKEAELRGQGQLFKEVFATGTIQSEAAANQVAISGREAQMTMAAARASQEGDAKAATEYQKQARLENSANQRDANKLQLATLGDQTAAGKTQMESMAANNAYYRAETAITAQLEREGKLKNISEDEKRKLIQDELIAQAKKEQTEKKPGSESTEALVKLGARAQDAESALYNGLVIPLNKDVGPALKKFNEGPLSSAYKDKTGEQTTKVKAAEKEIKEGYDRGKTGKTVEGVNSISDAARKNQPGGALENVSGSVGETIGFAAGKVLIPGLDGIAEKINPTKRAEGGVINNPELAIIGEAGKEYVVPEDKMQTLMQNVKLDGLQSAAKALSGGDKGGGVNIGEISNLVKTTISSASGPTSGAASAPMSKNEKFQTADWADATQEEIAEGLEGSKKQLAMWTKDAQEAENRIAEIKAEGNKRELDTGEQFELATLEKEKAKNQRAIEYHQSTINVLSNLDEYKARLETESKQKVVSATEAATKVAEDLGLAQIETVKQTSEEQKTLLTERQKTVLQYAYTDEEGKKVQLENAKNLVDAETRIIAEKNKEKEALEVETAGRELTIREQSRLERIKAEIDGRTQSLGIYKDELDVYSNLDKLKAETEIKAKTNVISLTEEQLAVQAEAERRIAQLKNDGVVTNEETAKVTEEQVAEMRKKAEAQVAEIKKMETPTKGIPDFSSMFGGGFLEKLNAQIKDAKPVEIKNKEEANKTDSKSTAAAVKKEPSPGKKINPETGEEYTPVSAKKEEKPAGTVDQVSLKDLHASLEHLNKSMTTLINYSQQTASAAQAQVKATKGLSSNKFA